MKHCLKNISQSFDSNFFTYYYCGKEINFSAIKIQKFSKAINSFQEFFLSTKTSNDVNIDELIDKQIGISVKLYEY